MKRKEYWVREEDIKDIVELYAVIMAFCFLFYIVLIG